MSRHRSYTANIVGKQPQLFCQKEGLPWPCDCEEAYIKLDAARDKIAQLIKVKVAARILIDNAMPEIGVEWAHVRMVDAIALRDILDDG